MTKKCIPGLFCIENCTLFIIILLLFFILFYLYRINNHNNHNNHNNNSIRNHNTANIPLVSFHQNLGNNNDPLTNPYIPPLRNDIQRLNVEYKQSLRILSHIIMCKVVLNNVL